MCIHYSAMATCHSHHSKKRSMWFLILVVLLDQLHKCPKPTVELVTHRKTSKHQITITFTPIHMRKQNKYVEMDIIVPHWQHSSV